MNQLELKIKEINSILEQISHALDSLNDENFDLVLNKLNQDLSRVISMKKNLELLYGEQILKSHEAELSALAKQINERFDNIIRNIKNEQESIKTELINIQNKKKLANYNR